MFTKLKVKRKKNPNHIDWDLNFKDKILNYYL